MKRREFITLLGGAATWPYVARAQQSPRVRRIGILARGAETELGTKAAVEALREGLAKLGWVEGRSVRIDLRYSANDPDRMRAHADELVRLLPDVIVVGSLPTTRVLLQQTRTIPIVFTSVGDPVTGGLLKNIARPEGNVTGITSLYESIGGKWLELLKEAAPRVERVALVFAAEVVTETYFAVMDAAARALGIQAIQTPFRNAAELERAIDTFATIPNGGLVMVPPPPSGSNLELINRLALRHRLPTISANKFNAADGILMSYGSDSIEPSRIAASYVDRLLRGAKISDLPVQFPTKFELTINLKTARAIGLDIPAFLRQRADEVIE